MFLLSGCSAQYELNISKDNIEENIILTSESDNDNYSIENFNSNIVVYLNNNNEFFTSEKNNTQEYYAINKGLNNNYYTLNINYTFPFNRFIESNIVNHNFASFIIDPNPNTFEFTTSIAHQVFKQYTNLNNLIVKINISDDFTITDHNADSDSLNTLTWHINRDNYQNKPINFKIQSIATDEVIDSPVKEEEIIIDKKPEEQENNEKDIVLIVAIIFTFIFSLIIFMVIKKGVRK